MTVGDPLAGRLIFVVGKGGVGRTTVAIATALLAARRGRQVLAVETEGAGALGTGLAALRSLHHPPDGIERVRHLVIEGQAALEEYLGLIIPIRRVLRTVFESGVYQAFVTAAPGLRELMTVGKIWYEASGREGEPGAPDVVVVDAPATGHGLQLLRMPQSAAEAFGVGLVRREALRIVGLLRDPLRTAILAVTTPEEMPVSETIEMLDTVERLHLPAPTVVVNQVHRAPCSEAEGALVERAAGVAGVGPLVTTVARLARNEARWAEAGARQICRLEQRAGRALVRLPYLFSEEFGPPEELRLTDALGSALAERARALREAG